MKLEVKFENPDNRIVIKHDEDYYGWGKGSDKTPLDRFSHREESSISVDRYALREVVSFISRHNGEKYTVYEATPKPAEVKKERRKVRDIVFYDGQYASFVPQETIELLKGIAEGIEKRKRLLIPYQKPEDAEFIPEHIHGKCVLMAEYADVEETPQEKTCATCKSYKGWQKGTACSNWTAREEEAIKTEEKKEEPKQFFKPLPKPNYKKTLMVMGHNWPVPYFKNDEKWVDESGKTPEEYWGDCGNWKWILVDADNFRVLFDKHNA